MSGGSQAGSCRLVFLCGVSVMTEMGSFPPHHGVLNSAQTHPLDMSPLPWNLPNLLVPMTVFSWLVLVTV